VGRVTKENAFICARTMNIGYGTGGWGI